MPKTRRSAVKRACAKVKGVAFLAALLSVAGDTAAQVARVGRIERLAEVIGGRAPVKMITPSPRAQIGRGLELAWTFARTDDDVFLQDQLRVSRYMDVRLKVERPNQRGWLTFVPEPLTPNGGRIFRINTVAQQAAYVIPVDTADERTLSVRILSGALLVDWRSGRLVVVAAGRKAVIAGTRAAFAMDSSGTDGWLYVDEGTVTFPESPDLTVGPGQLVRLRSLGALVPETGVSGADAAAYQSATRYHATSVWAHFRPFWLKPAFMVPAIGAVAAGTTVFVATWSPADDRPRGTVVIRIPL